jgi:hypothetical protein
VTVGWLQKLMAFLAGRLGDRSCQLLLPSPITPQRPRLAALVAVALCQTLGNLTSLNLHQNNVTEPTRELLRARFGDRVSFSLGR